MFQFILVNSLLAVYIGICFFVLTPFKRIEANKKQGVYFAIGALLLSLFARVAFFEFVSGDMDYCLFHWYAQYTERGFAAFQNFQEFSDYPPAYLTYFAIGAKLGIPPKFAVKFLSAVFDLLLAGGIYLTVRQTHSAFRNLQWFTLVFALLCPTIISNSAFWGQCDVIYTFFCLMALYSVLREKYVLAILFLGCAFCFKIQTVFLVLPFALLYLKGKIKWWMPALLPIPYLVAAIPAVISGADFYTILKVYIVQSENYGGRLTWNAANIFAIFPDLPFHKFYTPALIWSIVLIVAGVVYVYKKNYKITAEVLITLALLSALGTVFFLPKMHERYFYLADILSIVFVLVHRRHMIVAISTIVASFVTYFPHLFKIEHMNIQIPGLLMAFSLIYVLSVLLKIRNKDEFADGMTRFADLEPFLHEHEKVKTGLDESSAPK